MTVPAPTFATAARSAAEEDAEIAAWITTHTEDVARLRLRLAEMPVNDTQRKHVRARLAEATAVIDDATEARAALAPRLEAEAAQNVHEMQLADWRGGISDCDILDKRAARIDRTIAWLTDAIATTAADAQKVAARSGLKVPFYHLVQPVPDAARLLDIVLGRLHVAGLSDEVPSRYCCDNLPPSTVAAQDSARRAIAEMREAIVAGRPASPAQQARARAEREAQQRQRDEADGAPRTQQHPAPPPIMHSAGR